MASKKTEYEKIMNALNLIDEQAEHGNTEHDEDVARAKAYEKVADFIKEMADKKITILMTDEDCSIVQGGGEFDWTFDNVDVHIALTTQTCSDCCNDIAEGEEVEKDGDLYCADCALKQ